MTQYTTLSTTLELTSIALIRIADALERISPPPAKKPIAKEGNAFVWEPDNQSLRPVAQVNHIPLKLLRGINSQRDILHRNTLHFAHGLPANNALLWGARGMGKSSLVKAIHAAISAETHNKVALVEIHREDIQTLPQLLNMLRNLKRLFLLFCDDLSFDVGETDYKSLKAALEGGIEGRPENVLFYATSNRRHLMPRNMEENENSTVIIRSETVEEKVSLSDRFGLWLGFHACDQATFLRMVDGYCDYFELAIDETELHKKALEWATTRGARSGRVAWQFIQHIAGEQGKKLAPKQA